MKHVLSEKLKFYYRLNRFKPSYEYNGMILDMNKFIKDNKIKVSDSISLIKYNYKLPPVRTFRSYIGKNGGVVRWFREFELENKGKYDTFFLYSIEEYYQYVVGMEGIQKIYYIRARILYR